MKINIPAQILSSISPHKILYNEKMSKHTATGTGGNAAALIIPDTISELCFIINELRVNRVTVIGSGSRLLISDRGYNGIIVKTSNINEIDRYGKCITASAGASLRDISDRALKEGLTGLEWAAADKGTLGAAAAGGKSCFGAEIADNIYVAEVITKKGDIITLQGNDIYPHGSKTEIAQKGYTVSRLILQLERGEGTLMKTQMSEYRAIAGIPEKSTGAVFAETSKIPNPALVIAESGLVGHSVGGAAVSRVNPNYIINNGNATSEDIYKLINNIVFAVLEKKGVQLKSNMKLLGRF